MSTRRNRNPRGAGARLREDLIAAASALLETGSGEEELSMRAVARQAGVAPQSVYLHFADKRALMSAVYEARFGELFNRLNAAATTTAEGPRARLVAICRAYCRYGQDHPGHYRVLFGTAGTPGWEPEQMPGMATWELLRDAVAECRPDHVDEVAVCLWAALHGLVTLRQDRPSFPWPDWDTLIETLLSTHAPSR